MQINLETNRVSRQNFVDNSPIRNNSVRMYATTPINDSVNFSGNIQNNKIDVDFDVAKTVANSLTTSTSGHRAVYGTKTFTPDVVELITLGVGKYAKEKAEEKGITPTVIIGGDTREATRKSLPLIAETLQKQGVNVKYIEKPVPTPLLAMMTKDEGVDIAVLMTASHNPWQDGGYNLVTDDGAIAPSSVTKEVGENILEFAKKGSWISDSSKIGTIEKADPYEMYKETIDTYGIIDWNAIRQSGISIFYDGLNGTGENVLPKLLDEHDIQYTQIKAPLKGGPNPTAENLKELSEIVKDYKSDLKIGLANDGDADRFGAVDENGNFIAANDVLLLAAHYLADVQGIEGAVLRSQGTTSELDKFAAQRGFEVIQTPVGFKYIGDKIIEKRENSEDILLAGEESGGLTFNKHIPEKDGIMAVLMLANLVAKEQKPISKILDEVKDGLGISYSHIAANISLKSESDKAKVMEKVQGVYNDALSGEKTTFGSFEVDKDKTKQVAKEIETYRQGGDGYKLYFTDGSSVLIRKSGTEPKIKLYIETLADNHFDSDKKALELNKEFASILEA